MLFPINLGVNVNDSDGTKFLAVPKFKVIANYTQLSSDREV